MPNTPYNIQDTKYSIQDMGNVTSIDTTGREQILNKKKYFCENNYVTIKAVTFSQGYFVYINPDYVGVKMSFGGII